jgi:hypothetical protein
MINVQVSEVDRVHGRAVVHLEMSYREFISLVTDGLAGIEHSQVALADDMQRKEAYRRALHLVEYRIGRAPTPGKARAKRGRV